MTGFSEERAAPHSEMLLRLFAFLEQRGYEPELLPVDGDMPDMRIRDRDGSRPYIDLKMAGEDQTNFAIKIGAVEAFQSLPDRVYVVWISAWGVHVDTIDTLKARIINGPRRPTGKGSNTDWYLVEHGGEPFKRFFT